MVALGVIGRAWFRPVFPAFSPALQQHHSPRSDCPTPNTEAARSLVAQHHCARPAAFPMPTASAAGPTEIVARFEAPRVETVFDPVSPAHRPLAFSTPASALHARTPSTPPRVLEAGLARPHLCSGSLYSSLPPCCGRPRPYLFYSSSPSYCCSSPRSRRPSSRPSRSLPSAA